MKVISNNCRLVNYRGEFILQVMYEGRPKGIRLSTVSRMIFGLLQHETTREEMIDKLSEKVDGSREDLARQIDLVVDTLDRYGAMKMDR